jgi:glyoxylase-like metal-dependent hydrolase (beta-lactamase superfamily II)
MEVLPAVHAVPLRGARGYVVLEPEITLIDTGLPGSLARLERFLAAHGRSLRELRRIICTHGHPDHAGAARELVARASPEVEVLIHRADLGRLSITPIDAIRRPSRGALFAAITPPPERGRPIEDGDVLPVLGGLEVVHTPGHTPGSICLYAPAHRALFVGDSLERRFGRVSFASRLYSDDYTLARQSVKRMAVLDVEVIAFGHWPPLNERANQILRELASRVA